MPILLENNNCYFNRDWTNCNINREDFVFALPETTCHWKERNAIIEMAGVPRTVIFTGGRCNFFCSTTTTTTTTTTVPRTAITMSMRLQKPLLLTIILHTIFVSFDTLINLLCSGCCVSLMLYHLSIVNPSLLGMLQALWDELHCLWITIALAMTISARHCWRWRHDHNYHPSLEDEEAKAKDCYCRNGDEMRD